MALTDIDPDTVAKEAIDSLIEHLHRQAFQLAPGLTLRLDGDPGCTDLGATVRALAHYAKSGLPVWDWTESGMASDGLLSVLAALYSRAADHSLDHTAIDVVDDVDPETALGLVCVAAAARIRLDQRAAVTARELAALSGLSARRVRQLLDSGELEGDDGRPARIKAKAAVRWLTARDVPGFRK